MNTIVPISATGAVSNARCGVCNAEGCHKLVAVVEMWSIVHTLFKCRECGTHFYDPLPAPDYSSHTDDPIALRYYVEYDANIGHMLELMAPLLAERPRGSLLDIGCGYGFTVDLAHHLFGWDARGVEPSTYGRVGAEMLRFPLLNELLTLDDPYGGKKFDVIQSLEVIEHTREPGAFIDLLLNYLAPDGTIILTTPAAGTMMEDRFSLPQKLAFLSPDAHTYLFVGDSLRRLLHSRGLTETKIENRGGTLVAYASRVPLSLYPAGDLKPLLWQYYEGALKRVAPHSTSGIGFGSRYFCSLTSNSHYEDAERVWQWMDLVLPAAVPAAQTLADSLEGIPVPACELAYMRGMLLANHVAMPTRIARSLGMTIDPDRHRQAANSFHLAFEFAKQRLDVAEWLSNAEGNLFWPARFHQALMLRAAGEHTAAAEIARGILDPSAYAKYRPKVRDMDADMVRRTRELLT